MGFGGVPRTRRSPRKGSREPALRPQAGRARQGPDRRSECRVVGVLAPRSRRPAWRVQGRAMVGEPRRVRPQAGARQGDCGRSSAWGRSPAPRPCKGAGKSVQARASARRRRPSGGGVLEALARPRSGRRRRCPKGSGAPHKAAGRCSSPTSWSGSVKGKPGKEPQATQGAQPREGGRRPTQWRSLLSARMRV